MKMKKFFVILLVVAVCFAETSISFANEVDDCNAEQQLFEQGFDNKTGIFVTDQGEDVISVDLYQADSKSKSVKKVGKAKYRLKWNALYDDFEGQWSLTLTNGDKIKGVKGKMIVKKDNLGPINPTLQHLYADEYYSYGTLFSNAEGIATGSRTDEYRGKLHYNTKIILQWRDFTVKGVEHSYVATNGERQGTITDLDQYPN